MLTKKMKSIGVKGFSLVELMVVVAIIGILAAVAIPNFQRFQRKARQSEGKAALSSISASEAVFFDEWQEYYGDLREIGHTPPQGAPIYDAGFAAVGGVTDANLDAIPNYPRQVPNISNTVPNLRNANMCAAPTCQFPAVAGGAGRAGPTLAAITNSVNPDLAANTYTAAANAWVGGAAIDVWTINQQRELLNVTDGTR